MPAADPGYFGKLPSRGDFLSRRVPPAIAAAWDGWLAGLTTAVRDAAGDAWPDVWLTAPLWHFALGASVLGASAAGVSRVPGPGAAGLLIASVDRVGRMFPFTIIGPCTGVPEPAWSAAIEALALDALADDFDPGTLDRALITLGPAPATAALPADATRWWCRGSDRMPPTQMQFVGLPDADACAAMVLG